MTRDYEKLAKLYAEVFADPPWNEFTIDLGGCGKYYGRDTKPGQPCSCGNGTLEPAYPLEKTKRYIEESAERPGAVLLTNMSSNLSMVGFSWGFIETPAKFAEEKYQEANRKTVTKALESGGLPTNKEAYYIAEVGIKSEFRGKGYGSILVVGLLGTADGCGLNSFMRTNKNSPMVRIATKKDMHMIPKFEDPENAQRVLFVKER